MTEGLDDLCHFHRLRIVSPMKKSWSKEEKILVIPFFQDMLILDFNVSKITLCLINLAYTDK